ncbi:MAG: nucleoside-diphosphate kinase [Pseudonocardia sp.]
MVGRVVKRFEDALLTTVGMKMVWPTPELIGRRYRDVTERHNVAVYEATVQFMCSGPVVALVLEAVGVHRPPGQSSAQRHPAGRVGLLEHDRQRGRGSGARRLHGVDLPLPRSTRPGARDPRAATGHHDQALPGLRRGDHEPEATAHRLTPAHVPAGSGARTPPGSSTA